MRLSNGFFALAMAATSVVGIAVRQEEKRYAILDNDWSSTGYIPFLMALDAGIEVLALTSCTADTWQNQVAYHALATLEVGGLSCIPVVRGATWPLLNTPERFQSWLDVHGTIVWQGAFAPYNATAEAEGSDPTSGDDPDRLVKSAFLEGFPTTTVSKEFHSAASFMVEQVRRFPGQVSIYAAGALTNVALAVRMDPEFAKLAKELVIMGGYVDVNLLQATGSQLLSDLNSDINLMIDPEAAKIALTADFPTIKINGNVANQVMSTQSFLDEVHEVSNPYTDLFYKYYGTEFPFWDETAMATLADPSVIVNSTTVYIDVDTAYASPSYGNIHVYQEALAPPRTRNVTYVFEVDASKLKGMIKKSMQKPATCKSGKVVEG